MSPPGGAKDADDQASASSVGGAPLIIVSAQGHNNESRRIVRAQAARASAAQSRVTRARNREDRTREPPNSPPQRAQGRQRESKARREQRPQSGSPSSSLSAPFPTMEAISNTTSQLADTASSMVDFSSKPMIQWLVALLNLSATAVVEGTATLASATLSIAPANMSRSSRDPRSPESVDRANDHEAGGFRLPMALPRGFAALQQRIQISSAMGELLCRTACIDFASPGLETRLHQLLFDLVIASTGTTLSSVPANGHPIQGHLRVACTCLTISFLCENLSPDSAYPLENYTNGFHAAWSETMLLDRQCLDDEKSAEVALWAMFVIGVTTGGRASHVSRHLQALLAHLQLHYWDAVRRVLLEFIYPVSFLDQPCKDFYGTLYHPRSEMT